MNKRLQALTNDRIARAAGGFVAPVYKNNSDGTRTAEKFEIFDNKTGKHVGFAANFDEAMELDMRTNHSYGFGGHHGCPPPPPPGPHNCCPPHSGPHHCCPPHHGPHNCCPPPHAPYLFVPHHFF